MGRGGNVIAFLLGGVMVLLFVLILVLNSASSTLLAGGGGGGSASGDIAVVTGAIDASRDALYVVDTKGKTVCAYEYYSGQLNLKAVRNIKFDLQLFEYPAGRQSPSVNEVRRMVREIEKATKGKPPKKGDK